MPHWSEISTPAADSVGVPHQPRLASVAVLGLTLIAALSARPAQAQEGEAEETMQQQRIYIVSHALEPELEAVAARAGSAARSALREVSAADWSAADQRYLGYDDAALQHITEARRLLAEGSQAYLDLQLDNATQLLGQAIEEFDASQSALEDESGLGQALLYLGASYIFNGQTRVGRSVFERLHRQMPHIRPDPNEFPPEVVEQFERSTPRNNEGAIHIMSDPTGAIAYVDFVPRGQTPITVTGLVPGEHTVRLTRPGATPYIEQVDVGRGQSEVQAFLMDNEGNEGLAEMVAGITGHELEEGDGPIRQVGELLQLDKIGVIRVSYGDSREQVKLEMVIFDVASGRRVLRGEVQAPRGLGELEPVVQRAVKQGVESVLRPQVGEDDETIIGGGGEVIGGGGGGGGGDEEETPLWKKWWLWAAVGAVVVAGVIVTAVVVAGGDSDLGQNPNGQVVIEFGSR